MPEDVNARVEVNELLSDSVSFEKTTLSNFL